MPDVRCVVHDVPTIAVGNTNGAPTKLEVGTIVVDRYIIDGLLSQGGMGALLRARVLATGENVVIKVLRGQRISELQNVRRFYQEARVASALHHPNIVRIIEFGVDEATRAPFIAMEHVEGQTLKALIGASGALSEARTAAIFVQIARALSAAHDRQILHRDLKPSNVMVSALVDGEEHVKVLDFGLAKILHGDAEMAPLTQPGKTVGTPAYMSPEQVTQRPQDFRSDLYGLGCMLHAALTGGPPFVGDDLIAVMRKQMRDPPPPLPDRLFDGRIPSFDLVSLHRRLLKKNKNERPGSTLEVVEVFEGLLFADKRSATTSPKEPRHELAIMKLETEIESEPDRRAIETISAGTDEERPSFEVAQAATTVDPRPVKDAPTVLSPAYVARDDSATQLGGVPAPLSFTDALAAATISGEADGATDEALDAFAATVFGERTDPTRDRDGGATGLDPTVPHGRPPSRAFDDGDPTDGWRRRPALDEAAQEPTGPTRGTLDDDAQAPTGPTRGTRAPTPTATDATYPAERASDSGDGPAYAFSATSPTTNQRRPDGGESPARSFVDDASSEDLLTTIVPTDLDGSEVVDAGTPVLDAAARPPPEDRDISSTRRIDARIGDRIRKDPAERVEPHPADLIARLEDTADPDPPSAPEDPEPHRSRGVILLLLAAAALVAATATAPVIRDRFTTAPDPERPVEAPTPPDEELPRIVPRARTVRIVSRPAGAQVYVDDELVGETPLSLDAPTAPRILRFEKRGFRGEMVELPTDVGERIEVRLRRQRR